MPVDSYASPQPTKRRRNPLQRMASTPSASEQYDDNDDIQFHSPENTIFYFSYQRGCPVMIQAGKEYEPNRLVHRHGFIMGIWNAGTSNVRRIEMFVLGQL